MHIFGDYKSEINFYQMIKNLNYTYRLIFFQIWLSLGQIETQISNNGNRTEAFGSDMQNSYQIFL